MSDLKLIPVSIVKFNGPHDVPGYSMPEKLESGRDDLVIEYSPALKHFVCTGPKLQVKRGDKLSNEPLLIAEYHAAYWRTDALKK